MYPLQHNDELADHHQIPYIPNCQPDKSQQDLITLKSNINLPVIISSGKIRQPPEKRRLSQTQTQTQNIDGPNHDHKLKRIMHRDIERQRRQEMANLYASLRSLLPLEYIKGKRSISDHMHEAVNYIKYLERSIGELGIRRNKLIIKKSNTCTSSGGDSSSGSGNGSVESFSSNSLTVTVNPCPPDGLEILVGSNLKDGAIFPLSRVLKKLMNQGINVVSCISANVNERLVHKILTEVSDPKCIDNMALQQKLTNVLTAKSID